MGDSSPFCDACSRELGLSSDATFVGECPLCHVVTCRVLADVLTSTADVAAAAEVTETRRSARKRRIGSPAKNSQRDKAVRPIELSRRVKGWSWPAEPLMLKPSQMATRADKSSETRKCVVDWLDVWLPLSEYCSEQRERVAELLVAVTHELFGYYGIGVSFLTAAQLAALWNRTMKELGYVDSVA